MTVKKFMPRKKLQAWFGLSLLIIVVDQWTKNLASSALQYGMPVDLLPMFSFTLQHNTGAAFSFLSDAGGWQRWFFSAISFVVSVVFVIWMTRLSEKEQWLAASLSLILGGAIGNLWDRLQFGYVVDFLSVHYQSWYFPAFNIADAAITVGAIILILDMFLHPENHK
jgi:signal peptidase II